MTIAIGTDIVEIARIAKVLERQAERFVERILCPSEQEQYASRGRPVTFVATRFAAKEALVKAVGDPRGLRWHEVEIVKDALGKPSIVTSGTTADFIKGAGIQSLHLSISHDGGKAIAMVVAEGGV